MSIIYDALKKIEKNVKGPQSVGKENSENETKTKKKINPLAVYIFVVLAVLLAGWGIFSQLTHPAAKPVPVIELSAVGTVIPEDTIISPKEELPLPPPPDPDLNLNGIYFQGNEGYALINNRIVAEDDSIQGATVKEISLDKVILEFDGRTITLTSSAR